MYSESCFSSFKQLNISRSSSSNAPSHKARMISNWFLEHVSELTVLKWPPQSPDLNLIEHLWDVVELDVHPTNLHQLQDAILSICADISKECFQHLVKPMPRRIKAVLKATVWCS